jgi:hypothetical protein
MQSQAQTEEICPICYAAITTTTGEVRMSCSHKFHLNCIGTWLLGGHGNCPYCRTEVQPTEELTAPPPTNPIELIFVNNDTIVTQPPISNQVNTTLNRTVYIAYQNPNQTFYDNSANNSYTESNYMPNNLVEESLPSPIEIDSYGW